MKKYMLTFKILFALLLIMVVSAGSNAQTIEGDWYGLAKIPGFELRINIHVSPSENGYTSTWDSPDQGAMGIPSTTTSYSYPDFSFSYKPANFEYSGKVDTVHQTIRGQMTQNGNEFTIDFQRTPLKPAPGSIADMQEKYNKKEVYITMRDGVRLFTSVYTPKNRTGLNPILLNRTPYCIEPGGPEKFNYFMAVYSKYPLDNYIMVFQDVRGKYMSEGTFEDIRPVMPQKSTNKDTDETTDTWDTVDWLVKNVEGNNGNVGIMGISYPGFYSTMGIIEAHPAVKAVSPQAPVTAWFVGDDVHHNGAFFVLDNFNFDYSNGRAFKSPTRDGFPRFIYPVTDNYQFYLSAGSLKNLKATYFGDSIKFWNDAFAHPDYDEFWKARDPRQFMKNVKPAVMTVGGWFDAEDLYGALHLYKAIEEQNPETISNTLVMGPWSHGQWAYNEGRNLGNIYWGQDANAYYKDLEKRFFDFYLKGQGNEKFPEASVFVTGSNEWRDFPAWPPAGTSKQSLYLEKNGKVIYTVPREKSFDEYISDPKNPVPYTEEIGTDRTTQYMTDDQRFASKRPDVLDFSSDILVEDQTLAGPITADLFVSTTGTDADFIVKVIDVFPDTAKNPNPKNVKIPIGGYQMMVRGDVFRGKYRNSFEKPEAFTPGKVAEVRFELPDVAHTFKKGHRIMIQVQSSWFPLVDMNPQKFLNIYQCQENDFQKAAIRIYHGPQYPSHIEINVLK